MDKNLVRAVALATQKVFQDLIGWEMHVDGITTNKDSPSEKPELNAIISFKGTMSGAFILDCSERLSAAIASEMLGLTCEEGSADSKDAIGELDCRWREKSLSEPGRSVQNLGADHCHRD